MMKRLIHPVLILALFVSLNRQASASDEKPLLHPLFADHAVLQRDRPVPVWGWAEPGTDVNVRFAEQSKEAQAGPDGRWMCTLDPLKASTESRTLTVETNKPELHAEASDVVVGDLWICSGQSNMSMQITLCNEEEEIAKANHPNLRLLTIPQQIAYTPQSNISATWDRCTPETLRKNGNGGAFSAAAYFFGQKVQEELGIPIGLIHSSWGGTMIEAWTSAAALKPLKSFDTALKQVETIATSSAPDPMLNFMNDWFSKNDIGTKEQWFKESTDVTNWKKDTLPAGWNECALPGFQGIVWAHRQVELPAEWAGQELTIQLGTISDTDTTWFNGKEIGRTSSSKVTRSYKIPAGIAKTGRNVITLRITNVTPGGIAANEAPLRIHPTDKEQDSIALDGEWQLKESAKMAATGRPLEGNPHVPSVLYNGMIAPLVPCALTGAIWYQGEANASRAQQYRTLLPTLIQDWRSAFQRDDMAFQIVSLANYQAPFDKPRNHPWAELREAQAVTAKTVPNCGLAVAIDIGEENDIHPKNKREIGRRLALSALATTYGKPIAGLSPSFRSMEEENGSLRLYFNQTQGALKIKGPSDKSFAIAGKDRKFVWATVIVDGTTLLLSSPEVPKPVAVRYAWDGNPQACLYNGVDLPAIPFRTDDWIGK